MPGSGEPPDDDQRDPREVVLRRVLGILALLLVPTTGLTLITSRSAWLSVVAFVAAALAIFAGMWLLRKGRLSAVGWVFSATCLGLAGFLSIIMGGIDHNFVLLFPLAVLFARLAMGRRGGLVVGGISLVIGCIAVWLDARGLIRSLIPEQSMMDELISFAVILAFILALADQSFSALEHLLSRERDARERLQRSGGHRGLLARLGQRAVGTPDAQAFARGMVEETAHAVSAPTVLIAQVNNRALTPLAWFGIAPEAAHRVASASARPLLALADAKYAPDSPSALILPDLSPLPALVMRINGPDACLGLIMVVLGRSASDDDDDFLATVAGLLATVFERDRQRAQQLLAEKLGAARQLAGSLAHQVNNMLAAVVASADAIERQTEGDPKKFAQEILQQARSSARMTRHLLNLSQREVLRPEPNDLSDVLHEVLNEVRPGLPPQLNVTEHLQPGLFASVDRAEMAELFLCLLENSREAMAQEGSIDVRLVALTSATLLLEVTDIGCGMSPQVLARAGDPFFTTWPGHAGLGLNTVRLIAERRGGTMSIRSQPDHGTTVRIELPRADVSMVSVGPPRHIGNGDRARHILIVEDNETLRRAVARALRAGTKRPVLEAADGQQALAQLDADELPAAVISDVLMPIVGGIAVARRARELGIPVLLMSGYSDEKAEALGQFDFLAKPMEPSELIEWVARVLPDPGAPAPSASTALH